MVSGSTSTVATCWTSTTTAGSGARTRTGRSSRRDDEADLLELLDVGVAGFGDGALESAEQVEIALRRRRGSAQDLVETAERPQLVGMCEPATRKLRMRRGGVPPRAAAGRLGSHGQRFTEHHGVGPASQCLGDVTAGLHVAGGDDMHVATAGLVEIVA